MVRSELGVAWSWSSALRGAIVAAPAAVAAFDDPKVAAALAIGVMPVVSRPLAPGRPDRLRAGVFGVLAAASVFLGGFVAQWPVAAVVGLLVAGGLIGRVVATRNRPGLMVGLLLCLPLAAVGLSYPGTDTVAGLAVDMLAGTAWAVLVALAWPVRQAPAGPVSGDSPTLPPASFLMAYGWVAGLAGAVCAAIGFAADLEHVGWAPAAALLVMRPNPPVQRMRSLSRLADVVIGAGAAILVVRLDPASWVYAVAVVSVVAAAAATAASRWYVLPTFTTCLVFLLLLVGSPGDAALHFYERLLETGLGVGVASLATFVLLPALQRRRSTSRVSPSR